MLAGFVSGALFTVVGGGGSALAVPVLTTLVGITRVRLAMGTTAVAVALTALQSAVVHARRGNVSWSAASWFVGPGFLGIGLGTWLQHDFSAPFLMTALAVVLLFNAAMMVQAPVGPRSPVPRPWRRLAPAGMLVGLLAGMLGVGGGFLALPSMMLGSMSLMTAIGSSVVSVGTLGAASALSYSFRGLVDWRVVVEYAAGGLFGSVLVSPLAHRLRDRQRGLAFFVTVMLMAAALYLMASNLPLLYRSGRVL
nr:sulfite exporter TauE/SafE family protein [Sulfobacillus harzensis]